MTLITTEQRAQLLANGIANDARRAAGEDPIDHRPVVMLYALDNSFRLYLTEMDCEDEDSVYGVAIPADGCPSEESFLLSDITAHAAEHGTSVGSFLAFETDNRLSRYYDDAYSTYDAQFYV